MFKKWIKKLHDDQVHRKNPRKTENNSEQCSIEEEGGATSREP